MRLIGRLNALFLVVALISGACASYDTNRNPALKVISTDSGYRYATVRFPPIDGRPFVILSFSGGGTRAAAFSFGLMEGLRRVEYTLPDGSKRRLLSDIEIISSVSGGSFTSAYYALFPERFFEEFPKRFLYADVQGKLIWKMANPYNWFRLAQPDFSRIDMAEEYYGEAIFENKKYSDLLDKPRGSVPFVVLNATDIGINHRFEFTQDQFDLLCSDMSGVALSRAVAASSNFPVAFAPLTLLNYKHDCGPLPEWIALGLERTKNPKRRLGEATAAMSYRDPDRRFVHLLDGGLSDNLGLRGPIQAVTTLDSPWSVLRFANLQNLDTLMVIAANAKTTKHRAWDAVSTPPGITSVLDVLTGGPMDDVSLDSIDMIEGHFSQMRQMARTVNSCNRLLDGCPGVPKIDNPMGKTDFTFVELTFDNIPDRHLRICLQELPTSFSLPKKTVDLLRVAASYLLMNSGEFIEGMRRIDPSWKPLDVQINPSLIDQVCGPGLPEKEK